MAGAGVNITQSPTFCPAPWTMLNIDQQGRTNPCFSCTKIMGNIKHNTIQEVLAGPVRKEMRDAMAAGQWAEGCSWCKRLEQTSDQSPRTQMIASQEVKDAIDADPENYFVLQHFVVNWSNLCNLTCTYCNPETSTAWQSVKKIPINHIKNEHNDLIELAKTQGHNIQGLSLGGGEPLLQKGLVEFLDYIDPNKVTVLVTTNLSVDIKDNPVYQKLKTWKKVDWMISFDNADKDKFEYVRHGASWEMLLQNIQQMKKDNQHIQAHPAYSIYNALDLVEYYDFCTSNDLDIFWCELNHPETLDIRRAPDMLKTLAIREIDAVVDKYHALKDLSLDTLQRYRKMLIDSSYLRPIHNLTNPLRWHSDIETQLKKTTKFKDLWPTLAENFTMKQPYHFGQALANQHLDWLPTDTQETFNKMMQDPEHRQYFHDRGWDQPGAISYKINSHGFRCEEFSGGPYLLALGCSFTFGTGLPVEYIWPSIVGKELGLKVANISWGGHGSDSCFRLGEYWIPELKPNLVVMLTPPAERFELLLDFDLVKHLQPLPIEVFMPTGSTDFFKNDNYVKHWFLNSENARLAKRRNELAVKQLCSENNIECIILDAHKEFSKTREEVGYARDYMHAGLEGHRMVAEKIINGYRKKS